MEWPNEYKELEDEVYQNWNISGLDILQEFTEGRSSARVYYVDIKCDEYDGQAILKLDRLRQYNGDYNHEGEKLVDAHRHNNHFSSKHLPTFIRKCKYNSSIALLSTIAGDSVHHVSTFENLGYERKRKSGQLASEVLLEGWNSDYDTSESAGSPRHTLTEWLGYRLHPDKGGNIHNLLDNHLNISDDTCAFSLDGEWYPNPLAFASREELWEGQRVKFVKGYQHGDLNTRNVLVEIPPSFERNTIGNIYFIDLDLYDTDTYLFYDHSYLEVSYLINSVGDVPFSRWDELMKVVAAPNVLGTGLKHIEDEDVGAKFIVESLRSSIQEWLKNNESSRKDHIEGQCLLSRVASGLNFANKSPLSDRKRLYSFIYSSNQLKRYLTKFGISWEKTGEIVSLNNTVDAPETDRWREVWESCNHLRGKESILILIAGPIGDDTGKGEYEVLGNIPWSLVIDFDQDKEGGLVMESVVPQLKNNRACHVISPGNIPDINYSTSTGWLQANYTDTHGGDYLADFHEWRRACSQSISELSEKIRNQFKPSPVNVLILADGIDNNRLRTAWERMDDVFQDDAHYAVVYGENPPPFVESSQAPTIETFRCSTRNLLSGLWKMHGVGRDEPRAVIPVRSEENQSGRLLSPMDTDDSQYLSEDLELVHRGLTEGDTDIDLGNDFWRGHEITWKEIDMRVDLDRDITSDISERLNKLFSDELKDKRTIFISLSHKPGAGATTVAKRIAWNFKERFPTIFIRRASEHTADRIDELYQLSGRLPVLAFAEGADIPRGYCIRLLNKLRSHGSRAILFYIQRQQTLEGTFSLDSPLSRSEAERFHKHYSSFADRDGQQALDKLMKVENSRYWSPFFFGFYAFGSEFKRIPDFVSACLTDIDDDATSIIQYLSLINRYSGVAGLSLNDVKKFYGISLDSGVSIKDIFGDLASRLILHREGSIDIVHPLISEEILRHTLGNNGDSDSTSWRNNLTELCLDFIKKLVYIRGENDEDLDHLFRHLFIHHDESSSFAEVIDMINSTEGQHRVLRQLTKSCPANAHFWTHLARHYMYEMKTIPRDVEDKFDTTYEAAKEYIHKSITLDEESPDHHHALGMAYRLEAQDKLRRLARQNANAESGLEEVKRLISRAEEKFRDVTSLSPESTYGYVACIQMITKSISSIFTLDEADNYEEFLSRSDRVSKWCREKLHTSENLLRKAKLIEKGRGDSSHIEKCQVMIGKFYEDGLEDIISSLASLMDEDSSDKASVRRTAVNAYLNRAQRNWSKLSTEELRKIYELMDATLQRSDSTSRDLFLWFQSYRRLPDFDIIRALDEMKIWSANENNLDANFYLYILYFIQWKRGALDDAWTIREHIQKSSEIAEQRRVSKTFSHEWWATAPDWCPLVYHKDIRWDDDRNFFSDTSKLQRLDGHIKEIKGPQAGTVSLGPFDVFFLPGNKFRPRRDEGTNVDFYLGFSYSGLRGWSVREKD